MRFSLPNLRLEAVVIVLAGAVFLLASALLPWWQLAGGVSPRYILLCRVLAGLAGILAAGGLITRRGATIAAAATVALLTPLLLILFIATTDASSLTNAFLQTTEAKTVWRSIASGEITPILGWTNHYTLLAPRMAALQYSLTDALEMASYFTKGGWFLALLGGAALAVGAFMVGAADVLRLFRRVGAPVTVAVALLCAVLIGRDLMGARYVLLARTDLSQGQYGRALHDYQKAIAWDARLDYDPRVHNDMGHVYDVLNETNQPDAWAYQGDSYLTGGYTAQGLAIYKLHADQLDANPTIRMRYLQLLINEAAFYYNQNTPSTAIILLDQALALDPTNLEAQYFLAASYTQCNEYAKALPVWRAVIANNESVGLFRLKYFGAAVYRKPITAISWRHMAWCYYQLGDADLATKCYEFSKEQGPTPVKDFGETGDS